MFDKNDPKLALMRLYIFSRKVIKFCKKLSSEEVITHLIIVSIHFKSKTIGELAEQFDVEHSWMSTVIGKLEKEKIVQKKPMKDTRFRKISLTEHGKKVVETIKDRMNTHCLHAFKNLTKEEIVTMGEMSTRINYAYEEPAAVIKFGK